MAKDKDGTKDTPDVSQSLQRAASVRPSGLTPPRRQTTAAASVRSPEVNDAFDHDVAFKIALVGAGQGGSKIAQAFWDLGYRRVAVFNTTDSDFLGLDPDIQKLSLDIGGAAKNMQLARDALDGRDEEVRDLFSRAWGSTAPEYVMVCVGLGGGSGSGSALPLVQLARKFLADKGKTPKVGAVVSLPSIGDGQKVADNAVRAFNELREAGVSPLIVMDNDKVHELYDPPMAVLLPKSNELVSGLFHVFNRLAATRSPHITFDRSELGQLLDGGIVAMGSADIPTETIKNPSDVSTAIRDQLATSVLADVDLRTGRKAACVFVAGTEVLNKFSKDYFSAGFNQLDRMVGSSHGKDGSDRVVHRGLYPDEDQALTCYTMVSELAPPEKKLQALSVVAGTSSQKSRSSTSSSIASHLNVD